MKPLTLKTVATAKAENTTNGQVRLIIPINEKSAKGQPAIPEASITIVFADPNAAREFEVNKNYSITIKPE